MNKFLNLFIFCILGVFVSGCASMHYNDLPVSIDHNFPMKDTKTTVSVGDAMLIQGKIYGTELLILDQSISKTCYQIPLGHYVKVGTNGDKIYFSLEGSNGNVTRNDFCDPLDGLYVSKNKPNEVCFITAFGTSGCYDTPFRVEKTIIPLPEIVQRTLYFSGLKYNRVHFMYTERMNNISIHTHEVSYDMSESQIIGYKGARIKILDASNESITYEVLSNFSERTNTQPPVEEKIQPAKGTYI